jgi:phage terminase large subunit-like protein
MTKPIYTQWAEDIDKGKLPACEKTKQAARRFLADLKRKDWPYVFVPEGADKIIRFISGLSLVDGKFAGKKAEVFPFQAFVIANLYGWRLRENKKIRRFDKCYFSTAKKNGKSSLISFIALTELMTEPGAQVYSIANTKDQASICFDYAKKIVMVNPDVREHIEPFQYTLVCKARLSRFKALSSDHVAMDGPNPSMVIADEVCAYKDGKLLDVITSGMGSRENGLVVYMSTANNFRTDQVGYLEYDYSAKILSGAVKNDKYFAIMFELDQGDDWKEEKNWIKANPTLGKVVSLEKLRDDCKLAIEQPQKEREFRIKKCNQWVKGGAENSFILDSQWRPAMDNAKKYAAYLTPEKLKGYPKGIGFDLSKREDLSAWTLCCYIPELEKYYFRHQAYIPQGQIEAKIKHDSILFQKWIESGIVKAGAGETQDYQLIGGDILAECQTLGVDVVFYDAYMAGEIRDLLAPILDVVGQFSQKMDKISEPTKDYRELIVKKLAIDDNPLHRWCLSNALLLEGGGGMVKAWKESPSSPKRIDTVVTSIMALAACKMARKRAGAGSKVKTLEDAQRLADIANNM